MKNSVTLRRCTGAVALAAAIASAARAQTVATPDYIATPVAPPGAFSFSTVMPAMGPQLPSGKTAQPSSANGKAPFYPTQIEQAYGINSLIAAGDNGAGQTIAIIDAYDYPNALSTLNTFSLGRSGAWTLPQMTAPGGAGPTFTQFNQSGGTALPGTDPATSDNWEGEEALDIEYVHSVAPQANIILYEANSNSNGNLDAAVAAARANPAVKVVTMSWSGGESSGEKSSDSTYFTTPGTRGTNGVTFTASTGDGGAPGGYPAFSPNVVAVGGTSLKLNTNNSYASESAWSGGGGGTSTVEAKPSYQTSYGTAHPTSLLASATSRATPDVSLDASPSTGVYTYDSYNANGGSGWFEVGGTSLSSPMFAGLVAIADQMRASTGRGSLSGTQTLAALYTASSSDFNDITTGNNGFPALTGYDLATGLGTPKANLLVPALANYGVVFSTSYSLTLSPATTKIHIASASTFATATITGSIVNTGSSGANSDELTYGGLGLQASGGTLSGGTLPLGAGTLAAGNAASGTTIFSSNTTGSFTITPTATSVLNLSATGTPTLSGSNTTTVAVYRLAAAGAIGGVTFSGNYHLNDSVSPQVVSVSNTAASDGYSEGLDASFGGNSSALTVSGSTAPIAAGATNRISLKVGVSTASVGAKSGTVSVTLISDGTGTSGLGKTGLSTQTISVTAGSVYRLAAPAAIAPISFGNVHVGATAAQALTIVNTAANDGWSEALDASFGNVPAGFTSSGSIGLLSSGGSSTAMSLAMDTSTPGTLGGSVTVNYVSDGTLSSGLGQTVIAGQSVAVTGNVYSGQGVWNTNGGGSWSDFSKWTADGGVPGIDGPLSAGDTALFGAALGAGSAAVTLDGASPHVSSLTFNSSGSYTIARGTGGTLNLDAGAGTAAIAVMSGNHTIAAPVTLASSINIAQSAGSSLTVSGAIGESGGSRGLTQSGPGLLVLAGPNSYSGDTNVNAGVLSAVASGALSPNSNWFVNGGTLDATAGPQTVKSLTIGPGGVLNLSAGYLLTCTNSATFGNGTLNILNFTPGSTEALIAYGAHANSGSDAFLSFTVDGSSSTGYQLVYQANELDITPALTGNNSVLVPSTSSLSFGRVLSTSIAALPVTVGLSSGTMNSTGATAAILSGGSQGAVITSGTASGAGTITDAPQNWTVNVALTGGLGPHSDTLLIQNTGDSGSGASGNFGLPFTGNLQSPISVAVSGTVVSARTVVAPATAALPGTFQGSYHAGDPISVPVAFTYNYPGGGSGNLSETESASVAAYSGGADANGISLAGGPDEITTSAGFTRILSGTAAVGSGSGSFTLNVTPELSSTATVTASYTISVTSGNMNWAGPSGGSWSIGVWSDTAAGGAPVAPGLNPAWTHSDVANFSSGTGSAATVNLDLSPSLRAIAFTGTTGYTLAGAGGTLSLNNGGGGAAIAVNASAQSVIDAPVLLADNLTVTGSGALLYAASSSIADNGAGLSLTLNASGGTLVLSGSDSFTGGTNVQAGRLIVTSPDGIADGTSVTVGDPTFFPPEARAAIPSARTNIIPAMAVAPVPEPATLAILAATASLILLGRNRRSAKR